MDGSSTPTLFHPDLATLLASRGVLAPETLSRARLVRAETGERLDSVLTRLGLVSEQALAQSIADATGLPIAAPEAYPVEAGPNALVSERFLRDAKAIILRETPEDCEVALVDPIDPYPAEALRLALGKPVRVNVARGGDLEAALDRIFGDRPLTAEEDDPLVGEGDLERLRESSSDAPAIRAINRLIALAVAERASDIHLEAIEDGLAVRLRVDGEMRALEPFPLQMRGPLVSRIKVMAGLNIAERRIPQDGRMRLAVRGHDIDLRVVTSPSMNGEGAVLRLLDRSNLTLDFQALGFDDATLHRLRQTLSLPHGIVLVTGPTGSGKTTTLYAALAELNAPERKILTIEDPIEYRLPGVNQTQVNPQIGLTFAAALRSFLRQDPDIMMVGEIRDLETAQVAVQASLTGHLILSTLHTNTAASAVTRLLDMGIEPFLITSTITGVLAQRLVRRLCPVCREPYEPPPGAIPASSATRQASSGEAERLYHARGCPACEETGYRGRIALLEFMPLDERLAALVLRRGEARELEQAAIAGGLRTMFEDGLVKARAGLTTIEEVLRVTRDV